MVRRTGPGVKRRIWARSCSNEDAIDPQLVEFLMEQLIRHPVEEQLDREDQDDEVVEPADDRDVVRDEVPSEGEVRAGDRPMTTLRPTGIRSSATSARARRAYSGARLAIGRNAIIVSDRPSTAPPADRPRPLLACCAPCALVPPRRDGGVYQSFERGPAERRSRAPRASPDPTLTSNVRSV